MKSILITQCLQNDFVKPIGKYDRLPNLLHIGYEESVRLMGINPTEGPVSLFMNWANGYKEDNFQIIHIRDWHNASDPNQKSHLQQFGDHCLMNTIGADFVFKKSENKNDLIINSTGLNDFIDSSLENYLSKYKNGKIRIGIIGVWTEAKIFFLAYDILSRFPNFEVAICSALTASSSLHNHYSSLDQLKKILNVHVYNSIGEFSGFLTNNKYGLEISLKSNNEYPFITGELISKLTEKDTKLIKYVFRGSKSVTLSVLDGGFSGNLVLSATSIDLNGHIEAPHVLKIGEQEAIGRERMSFEKIEQVLGNNAPRIIDFADNLGRGILKYRYASMGKGNSSSFQKLFMNGISLTKVEQFLKTIFIEQLGKFYIASTHEKLNLFDYYGFNSASLERVKKNIETVYGKAIDTKELEFYNNAKSPNPYFFYSEELKNIISKSDNYSYQAYVHGDLNGANIIIDAQKNVWIIDFFHTHRGHILKDLIKLENDLLYIYTPINNEDDFLEALKISKILFETTDLAKPLPNIETTSITNPLYKRTYETLKILRSFYPDLIKSDRNPTQLFIAQLRYSMHTLIFDESNTWQKKWALYNSGHFGKIISSRIQETGPLRIDFIQNKNLNENSLGLTILPGRKDFSRNLDEDIKEIKKNNIDIIIPLITHDEMEDYGVPDLIEKYKKANIEVKELPIFDQKVPNTEEVIDIIKYMDASFLQNKKIMIHCVGGLGRSGLLAASYLKHIGVNAQEAISAIRRTRSQRAIETKEQENFILTFNN